MTTANEYLAQCSKYVGWNGDTFNEWCGWPRGTAWCANFHSCVGIRDCGLPWSKNASAAGFASQFPRVDDDDVQPGDMVFFNWDGVQQVAWSENSHVAVVEWFDHDSGYFGVIEGNGNGGICRKTTYCNYSSYFTAFFRPPYVGDSPSYDDDGDDTVGDGVVYEVHTADGWLGPVNRVDDTEDGYAGWRGKPIDGIRAFRRDSSILRIQAIMDDGTEWTPTAFTGSMLGVNIDGDGYAGDIDSGHHIIGLRVFGAKCRVKAGDQWLGWTEGDNPTPEGDDFAGEDLWKKQPITAVQMML